MKISYIIKDISVVGGREKIIVDKMNNLVKLGYNISLINYNIKNKNNLSNLKLNSKIEIYDLNLTEKIRKSNVCKILDILIINFFKKLIFKKKVLKQIEEIKPDKIVSLADFGFEQLLNITNFNVEKILEIHGCYDYFNNFKNLDFLRKIRNYFEFKYFLKNIKKFDKVIILSKVDKEKWNLPNIEVIPNFYTKKETVKIKEEFKEKKFISAGRLSYEKGYDILINVWKEVVKIDKKIKIDIYGEGPEEEKIKLLLKRNNLESNIKLNLFTNKLDEKYKEYYGYILPSRFEAFPMVVLESMSNAVPVIGFNIECGIRDMITEGKEGYLITKYDFKKMAEKIVELYNNENGRKKMAMDCLKKSEEFTDKKIMKKWIKIFQNF